MHGGLSPLVDSHRFRGIEEAKGSRCSERHSPRVRKKTVTMQFPPQGTRRSTNAECYVLINTGQSSLVAVVLS